MNEELKGQPDRYPTNLSGQENLRFMLGNLGYNGYLASTSFKVDHTVHYELGRLNVGYIYKSRDEHFFFNLSKSRKIWMAGPTGAGKTFATRSIMDKFYAAGGAVAVLTDIKPEYHTSKQPVQEELRGYMRPFSKPTGLPVVSYYPLFLQKLTGRSYPDSKTCQIAIQDLTISDLITMLNLSEEMLTPSKRVALENSFFKFQHGEISTMEEFIGDIENSEDIGKSTAKSLTGILKNIVELGVIGDQFDVPDFANDICRNRIPILNLSGFEELGAYSHYVSAYVAVILRRLVAAKKTGTIPKSKHLLIILDEVNKFCPKTGNSSSKNEIMIALDLTRSDKISIIFGSQDRKRIPDNIFAQCSICILPIGVGVEEAKAVVREKAPYEYTNPNTFVVYIADMVGSMRIQKDGSRPYWVIDSQRKINELVVFWGPESHHKSEGE